MMNSIDEWNSFLKKIYVDKKSSPSLKVFLSRGTCGNAAGAGKVGEALSKLLKEKKIEDKFDVKETGCMGLCHSEPTLELFDTKTSESLIYGNVSVENIEEIIECGIKGGAGASVISRDWYYPELEKNSKNCAQARIVLRNSGRIDPESIEDYIEADGYKALVKSLTELTPESVTQIIKDSGLRGRGGGGFPTGIKWEFAAKEKSDQKYIICNADEGDPGAFMDRAVLEGDPHAVLEAMTIAGYAVGATEGIIYIRAEYPQAIAKLEVAIRRSIELGLLGENILGSGVNFTIEIRYGAGAFVCGEETALIQSIEGKRGMPHFKPPFPAVKGLWGKPTIVNNVETFANMCPIIRMGSDWFKSIGTEGSTGTKVFALAGKIKNVGLAEVEMGITLRDIIFGVGGGIDKGREFKAVQTGGPSGGCITAKNLDVMIDYDSLKKLGSMMGSGGMIIMDEDDCMVDIAKFFLDFTLDESCGKCTPCRVGGTQMYKILDGITKGDGTLDDLLLLQDLSTAMKSASLCGLGMTAPNPVLATLKCFEEEYREHIVDKKCKAHRCGPLITYTVVADDCTGCTLCARACPVDCISGEKKEIHLIDQSRCINCGACYEKCNFKAIERS